MLPDELHPAGVERTPPGLPWANYHLFQQCPHDRPPPLQRPGLPRPAEHRPARYEITEYPGTRRLRQSQTVGFQARAQVAPCSQELLPTDQPLDVEVPGQHLQGEFVAANGVDQAIVHRLTGEELFAQSRIVGGNDQRRAHQLLQRVRLHRHGTAVWLSRLLLADIAA